MYYQKVRFTITKKDVNKNGNILRPNWKSLILIVNCKVANLVRKAYKQIFTDINKVT